MGTQSTWEKARTQQVRPGVSVSGGPVIQRDTVNFIPVGATITAADNPTTRRVDVTVTATGGGSGTPFGVAAGTNTYTATLGLTSYTTGQSVIVQFTNANTGASTLNSDSLGAKAIQIAGAALTTGQITAGASLELVYDGTQFQIVGELGGVGPAGPANRFIVPLSDGNQSTKFDATTKRVLGQRYFDPTLAQWGTSGTSTATLYMILQTTNGAIAVGGDLYRETGAGSPVTVATLPTTTSVTAAKVSVDVSAAFKSTGTPGIFDCRFWITTYNGDDQATCSGAWVEVQP